jgi:NAD(P)-dependent dehydrogenase (short-subunit alcohol dehydrogenase family)
VRDEEGYTQLLRSLAPLDHVVFSGVDKIIRGSFVDANLDDAKHLFGVKFWGAVVTGKGMHISSFSAIASYALKWCYSSDGPILSALAKYDIVRSGGSLTLTSGTAALKPGKGAAIGGALNGGVLSLTKGLASELTDKKIRVNTVVPGLVKTELWDKLGRTAEEQEELFRKGAEKLSVGFVASPEHIAEAYLYCVKADYANGTLVIIGKSGLSARISVSVLTFDVLNRWWGSAVATYRFRPLAQHLRHLEDGIRNHMVPLRIW